VTQPTASQTLCVGNALTLTVVGSGSGTLTYQWKKNGTNIPGATLATYNVAAVTTADAATYTVSISSSGACGNTVLSNVAVVNVDSPAAIATQPVATQTLCEGNSVTLQVVATGTSLTYQWNKGGTPIVGATSSTYTIASLTTGDAATYTVDVTSGGTCANTVTSANAVIVIDSPASVVTQPTASQTLCVGSGLTLTVVGSGSGTLTYQWKKDGTAIVGATAATYNVGSVTTANAGAYTVDITTSGVCANTVTSNVATVIVDSPAAIAAQPVATQTLCEGNSVTLQVVATGTSLTYQWNKGGTPIVGATSSSYTIASLTTGDAATYTVDVTSGGTCANTVTSANAVIVIDSPASVVTQPTASQTLCVGSGLTLTVVGSGSGTLSYQWKKDGTAIVGATAATYNVASVTTANAGAYTVDITTSGVCANTVTSNVATVIVDSPAAIATQPVATQTLCAGNTVTLQVVATGTSLSYQWKKAGTPIVGATSSTYTIASLVTSDAATYTVDVTSAGVCANTVTSANAVINVDSPASVATQPTASQTLCVGSALNLSVVGAGSGSLTYQWKKNGTNVAGATSSTFTIASVTTADAATYTVTVTSSGACANTVLSNVAVVNVNTPAAITTQPVASQTLCTGNSVTLQVVATGTSLTYQWKKAGTPIVGATNSTYTISSLATSDAATYTVDVVSGGVCANTVTSANAIVVVHTPAAISTQPTASQTLCVGSVLSLSVVATGSGTLSYQWKKDGVAIVGANSATYSKPSATTSDAGAYTVDVTTSGVCANTVTSSVATVIMNTAALIVTQPTATQTICESSALSLSVTATGTSLTYQWKLNGTPIVGATSSTYSLASVALSNAGTYTVDVSSTGVCGNTVTSSNAVVNINAIPVGVSVAAGTHRICSGTTLAITPTSSVPGTTYSWTGSNGSGGTGIINDRPFNTTTAPVNVTYTVIPTGPTTTFCVGAPFTIIVTVNPIPAITNATLTQTICGTGVASFTPTINVASSTYAWTGTVLSGSVSGVVASGTTPVSQTLTNTGTTVATVRYRVTPTGPAPTSCVGGFVDFVVTVNPVPTVSAANQSICSGSTSNVVITNPNGVSGTTFSWTAVASGVTGASNSSGTVISQTLTSAGGGTVTYTITPSANGCAGTPVVAVVTVNPIPVGNAVAAGTHVICSGTTLAITPTSNVASSTFAWTGSNGSGGTGVIDDAPVNSTNAPVNVTYTIVPTGPAPNFCVGAPFNIVVTVNPIPAITNATLTQTICGTGVASFTPTINVAGSTYSWTSTVLSGSVSGVVASGSTPISQTLTNTGVTVATVRYRFTPTGPASTSCVGSNVDFTVTVNPVPTIAASSQSLCSGSATNIVITNPNAVSGTTFSWVATASGVTGASNGSGTVISQTLTSLSGGSVTYVITPSANGCAGTPVTVVASVSAIPVGTPVPAGTHRICSGTTLSITPVSSVASTTFSLVW
ncbi:MAG: PKD-like domain-containing protein, partial [Cyclobacteriaceae bacterium]